MQPQTCQLTLNSLIEFHPIIATGNQITLTLVELSLKVIVDSNYLEVQTEIIIIENWNVLGNGWFIQQQPDCLILS